MFAFFQKIIDRYTKPLDFMSLDRYEQRILAQSIVKEINEGKYSLAKIAKRHRVSEQIVKDAWYIMNRDLIDK